MVVGMDTPTKYVGVAHEKLDYYTVHHQYYFSLVKMIFEVTNKT